MEHPNQPNWTDQDIIEAFRRGGKWPDLAWEYMVKKWRGIYITTIKNKAQLPFVDDDEVSEALQEMAPAFLNKVRDRNWPGPTHQLSTYFAESVYNAWLKVRRRNNKLLLPGDENISKPEGENEGRNEEHLYILDQALSRLEQSCRELLHMYYWDGYSNEEITQMFGLNRQTVKNKLTICRKRLTELIEKLFKPYPKNAI